MENKILLYGNCIDKMKEMDADSVDAIATDPPYELGFMGKKWDASGIAYDVNMWKECLRVLKPGGHLLSFGGTRTYHRMAVAIEDAGFEIRDMLEWIYASGFPKSHNVGVAYDKKMGNERKASGKGKAGKGFNKIKGFGENTTKGGEATTEWEVTKGNSPWEGFGTSLKPAHEPIVLARKPLSEKTIVENCIKHGTGALDIDGCRIPTKNPRPARENNTSWGIDRIGQSNNIRGNKAVGETMVGRFPANLIVTGDALNDGEMTKSAYVNQDTAKKNAGKKVVAGGFGGSISGMGFTDFGSKSRYFDIDVWGEKHGIIQISKASKKERNVGLEGETGSNSLNRKCENCGKWERKQGLTDDYTCHCENPNWEKPTGNIHSTVKPVHLMDWLIRLVSKKGDTVLDPFMGSGTTGVSCKQLNRNFIGIELNKDYIKIAKARIEAKIERTGNPVNLIKHDFWK